MLEVPGRPWTVPQALWPQGSASTCAWDSAEAVEQSLGRLQQTAQACRCRLRLPPGGGSAPAGDGEVPQATDRPLGVDGPAAAGSGDEGRPPGPALAAAAAAACTLATATCAPARGTGAGNASPDEAEPQRASARAGAASRWQEELAGIAGTAVLRPSLTPGNGSGSPGSTPTAPSSEPAALSPPQVEELQLPMKSHAKELEDPAEELKSMATLRETVERGGPPAAEPVEEGRGGPRVQHRSELEAVARSLRSELQSAESRLHAAATQVARATVATRACTKRHHQLVSKAEDDAARLRAENLRLERSVQQARVEERRLANLLQAAPGRAEEHLSRLRAGCRELERENQRLELGLCEGRERLAQLREAVAREGAARGRPPPRTGEPARAPFVVQTAPLSASAAAAFGKCPGAGHLARHGSLPSLHGGRDAGADVIWSSTAARTPHLPVGSALRSEWRLLM